MKKILDEIILLIGRNRDDDLSQYNTAFLLRTIETRMSVTGISRAKEYCSFLSDNNPEIDLLFQSLQISYSEYIGNTKDGGSIGIQRVQMMEHLKQYQHVCPQ